MVVSGSACLLLTLLTVSSRVSASAVRPLAADVAVNERADARNADAEVLAKSPQFPKKFSGGKSPITRLWGIPDAEALVGHAFSLTIPQEAFSGPVVSYRVTGLPPWLEYLNSSSTLVGVPPREALGGQVFISVGALGAEPPVPLLHPSGPYKRRPHFAHDTFAITVLRRHGHVTGCSPGDALTRLVLSITHPFRDISPSLKVNAIQAFSTLSKLFTHAISMVPVKVTKEGITSEGTEIRVPVGCGDSLLHSSAVDRVKGQEAKLSEALGLPVAGWSLVAVNQSNTAQHRQISRKKRSPDYNYDYDYEYYEYDDYDPNDPNSSGDYYVPDERVVPPLATPVFTDSSPATVAPSEGDNLLPPVLRPVPISTPVFVPVKPTRVVVEPSPSVVSPTHSPTHSQPMFPTNNLEPTRPLPPSPSMVVTQSSSTTTESVPQVTDHLVRNFPPKVIRRIDKMAWIAGFVYRFKIPENTFEDLEDGNTRNLRLVIYNRSRNKLGPQSWIQFDPIHQEIYALPLEDNMGYWTYILEAIDSGGKTVQETIKIHIHQPKEARNYLHRYTATLKTAKKYEYEFAYALDWQMRVVQKIAALFDNNTDSINVRSISENPTKVSWTNVTLVDPLSTTCPQDEIAFMNEVLFDNEAEHEPSRIAVEALKPEFNLKKLHVHYNSQCEHMHNRQHLPDTRVEVPEVHEPPRNMDPQFKNQVDIVRATAGKLYRKEVPRDACYDMEDGSARNLRMRLLTNNLNRLPQDFWLQFDTNNQEFYGLPLDIDVGSSEFTLECVDSDGGKTSDSLEVVVDPSPFTAAGAPQPPVLFSLKFDHDYTSLMSQPFHKDLLVRRLGSAFGDSDAGFISVTKLAPGSVLISWFNTSLDRHGPCPNEAIQDLRNKMLTQENAIRAEFADHFLPEFVLLDGDITPNGACLSPDTPQHVPPPDVGNNDVFGFDEVGQSVSEEQPSQEDYLLTFLVPSILMAIMLLLAAIAACCLYRHRRRYAKMSLTNHATPPDTTTFVTSGIPVILAEELDDQNAASKSPAAKAPVIMKEEKPPLPPYRQSPPNRRGDQQPYQQPPPPFSNGRSSPRNTQPPAYRKPTFMPP